MSVLQLPDSGLWKAVRERSAEALRSGALEPIATESAVIVERGVPFVVRVLSEIRRKRRAALRQKETGRNPFLPYEEELFVADVSPTHVALLNKFNVLDDHLLIITRDFEEQSQPLALADFEALWACLGEGGALGFYNSAPEAGASQRHRHLQLVPLPLGGGEDTLPAFGGGEDTRAAGSGEREELPMTRFFDGAHFEAGIGRAPELPFLHAIARLDDCAEASPAQAASILLSRYKGLCRAAGCEGASRPYNLLATRDWLFLVPRSAGRCDGIPVNALGFAGAMLALDRAQVATIAERGPFALLADVSLPARSR
ncbi:MAG: phosphorylase [Deltaproteobacteria bacterium]|nr:phosphorylase [Deltaproteobacteria bacterium]